MNDSYLLLKSLHILGAILFLGNIIVTGWWKFMADRTRNPVIIAFAQRQVTLTDYVFTFGGSGLLIAAGISNAELHGLDYFNVHWLTVGFTLIVVSGVLWVAVLIPVQYRQAAMAREFANGGVIPDSYWTLNRVWYAIGVLDTVIPAAAIYWMVYKPV